MKKKKPRFIVKINTGERVDKPKKGKGSYDRRTKKGKEDEDEDK